MLITKKFTTIFELESEWDKLLQISDADPVFSSFNWYSHYLITLGRDSRGYVLAVYEEEDLVAIAPFKLVDRVIYFLASNQINQVTDYIDIMAPPKLKKEVWQALLDFIKKEGYSRLVLDHLHTSSHQILTDLKVKFENDLAEASPVVKLPDTFEEYLQNLPKKHRHELQRKMRRLNNQEWKFDTYFDKQIDWQLMLALMKQDERKEQFFASAGKQEFMTTLTDAMPDGARVGMATISLEGAVVSAVIYFETEAKIYLYNSGFDHNYSYYSVGLLVKAHLLKDAIESAKIEYDFLTGDEEEKRYKLELGGNSNCVYNVVLAL